MQQEGRSLDVFIQVNTSYEESKFGLQPADVAGFIKQLSTLDTLKIKGLMTIGLLDVDRKMRPSLTLLRQTRDQLITAGVENSHDFKLSMGMSQDLEMAIAEGSDMFVWVCYLW
ncbi:alanine racemase [Chitinophaga pinensis]|uniref:alanine racemase n=1 Tax=Chitinophaga pinensis TaxID=79329 RepID=UPI0021BD6EC3|nr:alanine racemase [Chitinophaga pinensis]